MKSRLSFHLVLYSALTVFLLAALHAGAAAGGGVDAPAVFAAKCAMCHAKDGTGLPNWRAKGQPNLADSDWQRSRTDSQIADAVRNGKGKYMPAFKARLSDQEINALVGQVRAIGKRR